MNHVHKAEDALMQLRDDQAQNIRTDLIERAAVYSMLAVSQAIESLGSDIRDAANDIATELGGISIAMREQ